MPVPHLKVKRFPEPSLSAGTVAPVRDRKQKSFSRDDSPFNSKLSNKVKGLRCSTEGYIILQTFTDLKHAGQYDW